MSKRIQNENTEINMEKLRNRLSALLKLRKMSARGLSTLLCANSGTVNQILNGSSNPSTEALFAIIDGLEVTPSIFFNWDVTTELQLKAVDMILALDENGIRKTCAFIETLPMRPIENGK